MSPENQANLRKAENMLLGFPKTHAEWAYSFNIIGAIKKEIE